MGAGKGAGEDGDGVKGPRHDPAGGPTTAVCFAVLTTRTELETTSETKEEI